MGSSAMGCRAPRTRSRHSVCAKRPRYARTLVLELQRDRAAYQEDFVLARYGTPCFPTRFRGPCSHHTRARLAGKIATDRFEVIPNAVDLTQINSSSTDESTAQPHNMEPFFLFVGRLDPQKGVDLLISAFARTRLASGFRLVVAGPSRSDRYREQLLRLARTSTRNRHIVFTGPVHGLEKWHLYRRAWAVIVPSRFESLGLVNLEAAACNTPTITTHETGLESWADNGGLLIRPNADDLRVALERDANWSDRERRERGMSRRRLVEEQYSWASIRAKWYALYESLVSAG